MVSKRYSHKVSMPGRRASGKATEGLRRKGVSDKALRYVFNNYYRDQVRALYRAVNKDMEK